MQNRGDQGAALLQLLTLLGGTAAAVHAARMLTDRSPDPGLFGPGSVTWRVLREPLLMLGGSRALLMQVAHPLVAQGVVDHSRFETEPFVRLLETSRWVYQFAFGTRAEAARAVGELHRVHEGVRGKLGVANATPRFGASTRYSALSVELGMWVYATLVQSMLLTHGALIGGLGSSGEDCFVREWVRAGELLEVRPAPPWQGAADLHAYVAEQISSGAVQPVAASLRAAATVLRPPLPWPQLAPVSRLFAFITTGLLPVRLQSGYGLTWTARDRRLHDEFCCLTRRARPYLPRRLRISPLYELAAARLTENSGMAGKMLSLSSIAAPTV